MIILNEANGAFSKTFEVATRCLTEFDMPLIGAEFGIAWGGGPEALGKLWKGRGTVYGFDTFEGHPKDLAYDPKAHEASCMDLQYHFGPKNGLSYDEQSAELDRQGLDNVVLRKGRINSDSVQGIPYLNYCLLDMDLIVSMATGFQLVKDLIVSGGYLCLHDVVPRGHLFGLWGMYWEIMTTGSWELVGEWPEHYLAILRRKP